MGPSLQVELHHSLRRLNIDVDFEMGAETLALVGPSGAGKSTILQSIAGVARPTRGRIVSEGNVLLDTAAGIRTPPEARRVGMVYQEGALFPFMTVLANVAYGIPGPRRARGDSAASVLTRFGIAHLARARPGELSGGERQRVALARAVASDPKILLLDEPLSALDAVTKGEVSAELEGNLRDIRLPAILVSHDFSDVLGLADRVAVLQNGRIVQVGTPQSLVEAPESPFVAAMTGVNYFVGTATARGRLTEVRGAGWARPLVSTDELSGSVGVVVYPWEISLSADMPSGSSLNAVAGTVRRVTVVGNRTRVALDSKPAVVAEVTEASVRALHIEPGSRIVASWKATGTRLAPSAPPVEQG